MKKNLIAIICGIVTAVIVVTGVLMSYGKVDESESIGSAAALTIALNDAGVRRDDAKNVKSHFEKENGNYIFDVEFVANNNEYDYDIDAQTGEILKREVESVKKNTASVTQKIEQTSSAAGQKSTEKTNAESTTSTKVNTTATQQSTVKQESSSDYISLEKAKSIALNNAGVSSGDAKFTKAKLDNDDGVAEYEIEFIYNSTEFEYDIDAISGKITNFDKEVKKTSAKKSDKNTTKKNKTKTQTSKKSYISVDKAKSIALKNAGLSSSSVKYTKAKLDYDDGAAVYEIEFVYNNTEYEYEIDAISGTIIDFDKEVNEKTPKKSDTKVDYDDYDDDYDD